ncbi:LuxR family transcriptional regulator [Methylobacterium sp. 092160098-2]|uniref:LuxR family transcriptional regulator n=1 Tax=Methylobacterium sp. 092160098-2 TaxID=3025129 RepID=UPI00238198AD|nr:LuxR family transcriptional regulator [Methylobacterium sp. 092160098-2]MDE4909968.1 LuxR family transcriptional regulator [Methylobacterium sp. 092160098-2]
MKCFPQSAFEVVAKLRSANCLEDILLELKLSGRIFGYDTFFMGRLPRSPTQNLLDCATLSGWPAEWERRYQAERFVQVDPVIRHIRRSVDPFLWREALVTPGGRDGQIVLEEARAFGLVEGFCVPLHHAGGGESGLSFGGQRLAPSNDERAALHLIGIYALSAARAILSRAVSADDEPPAAAHLTSREVECLKWSAVGKTAWEISVILSLSRRTVEQYLISAARKLGAVSRVQSVAEALRRGIID